MGTGVPIVNVSVSDLLESVADIAARVGLLLGDEGTEAGGV